MKLTDADARNDLLIYANEQFPDADRIRFLGDDFSAEIIALELKFSGVRVLAGISRPLWEHSSDFPALRAHMEKHHWHDMVSHETVTQGQVKGRVLLGDNGWVDWE